MIMSAVPVIVAFVAGVPVIRRLILRGRVRSRVRVVVPVIVVGVIVPVSLTAPAHASSAWGAVRRPVTAQAAATAGLTR